MEKNMRENWDVKLDTHTSKHSQLKLFLGHARKRGSIYAAASVFAIAAALGTAPFSPPSARAAADAQTAMPQKLPSFAPLVKKVEGAVVSLRVKADAGTKMALNEEGQLENENPFKGTPFEKFFKGPDSPFKRFRGPGGEPRVVMAQGSGFFISPDGYLVTNNHVADHAISLQAVTMDGKTYTAKVVGTDPRTDLALLKVDGRNDFPYVTFSRADPAVGDWVIALGNPFGLGGTVTAGIISAEGRNIGEGPYDDFLQIDAPVNRGNSGGPAFNQSGEVVGVNTAIYSPSGGSVGIAFAIPARTAEQVIGQLKEHGHVTRGWLGVQIQNVTPEIADSLGLKADNGALVSKLESGSPAEKSGVKAGDVITTVNGTEVKDPRGLARQIAGLVPGANVKLGIIRSGSAQTVDVKIGELADKPVQKAEAEPSPDKSSMGQLGIRVAPASEVSPSESAGLAIVSVDPESKGAEAGLTEGDIIVRAGGESMQTPSDLNQVLDGATKAGKGHVLALVKRNGRERFVALPVKHG
jgi:serine protease Do